MAQTQREYFQEKKKEAFDTRNNRPSERVLCYVGDYAQNLSIPNFAAEQPGETYYYSPLSCYCFGMVDCSTNPIRLAAMLYTEDSGKKGGNNVASCIWTNLERLGIIATPEPFKEINIVMDNCGGQNKNKMVLRLLFYLVKKKIAIDARIIFLIKGHTKNDCDRLFNLMKKEYRKSNVYTPKDLKTSIKHDSIDTVIVDPATSFRDWDAHEDIVLKATENVKANHIFLVSANRDNGNSMYMETHRNSGEEQKSVLVKKKKQEVLEEHWKTMPQLLPTTDILNIKWIELHDKWGKFIPRPKKEDWKYYNEDPGPERRNKVKANRKKSKEARQARTRTEDESSKKQRPNKKEEGPPLLSGVI
jgi:hypothetical protein